MKRKHGFFIFVFVFFFILASSPVYNSQNPFSSRDVPKRIIYVDDSNILGPWDGTSEHPFQHIRDGVNASVDNDMIYIYNGTYNETLLINKSIALYGEKTTVINGSYKPFVITILSDNVTILNLLIQNSGGSPDNAGLLLCASHASIENCTIYRTRTGIYAWNTSFHTIDHCTFYDNGVGVALSSSSHDVITGCVFGQNAIGVHCDDASDILITTSYFHTNGRACFFIQSQGLSLLRCNMSDNSVNQGGVFLDRCSTVTLFNSILRHNGIGIRVTQSEAIEIECCTLRLNTHYAILIDTNSSQVHITNSDISHGFRFGVYTIEASACTLFHNNIYSNTLYGVFTKHSDCSIKENYWGSSHGPSRTEFGLGDKVHMPLSRLKSIPWMTQPIVGTGANWTDNDPSLNRTIQNPIERSIQFTSTDTDGDGAPDWWEIKWGYDPLTWENHTHLDPDGDGLNNIEECYTDGYGSNPFHKDIFVEIDWMKSTDPKQTNKPSEEMIAEAERVFEQHNITLHVDVGNLDGGEEIPYLSNFSFSDLVDLYWQYFLHGNPNNPRKGIFRYGIICDAGPDVNFPFMGWDQLDSFLVSAQQLADQFPWVPRDRIILEASIHHLGHTLGLLADTYGGIDNVGTLYPFSVQWLLYRNYKSCMNYWYKYRTFSYSDGSHGSGDFNDYGHLDFHFFKNTTFRFPQG
jgi:parallel beta-helix repeat protein